MIEKILERLEELKITRSDDTPYGIGVLNGYAEAISVVQEVAKEYGNGWIPFTQREITEEEKAEFIYETEYLLTCKLPDDNTEIIVCYKNGDVGIDTFFNDCGECYLDSGSEFVDEVIAWQPLPAPYQKAHSRCDTCTHYIADKVPPICYLCSKGIEDNYERKGE